MDLDPKAVLTRYFNMAHEAILWKLEGVSDYDVRRPLTPTGTSLLGLVKHLTWVEFGYFGPTFDREADFAMPERPGPNGDMYAAADETREDIVGMFRRTWSNAQATIAALELHSEGHVPWWGDNNPVTLQLILVHMTTELHRHLGHIDILREQIDGRVGHRADIDNMAPLSDDEWVEFVADLESIAVEATGGPSTD